MKTEERLTQDDISTTRKWLKESEGKIPPRVFFVLATVLTLVEKLEPLARRYKKILALLAQSWDLTPASEKLAGQGPSKEPHPKLKSVLRKPRKRRKERNRREAERPKGFMIPVAWSGEQSLASLRCAEFEREKGATVSDIVFGHERVEVFNFKMGWTVECYKVGTTTNTRTGKTLRAPIPDVAPGGKFTYQTQVSLAILHVGYQMPITRLVDFLGTHEVPLAKSTVFGFLVQIGRAFLPIFFHLLKELASKAQVIEEDDFNTRINKKGADLETLRSLPSAKLSDAEQLLLAVDGEFGLSAQSAKTKKPKVKANLTVLSGLIDPKCRVVAKLTHQGGAGDLLGRLLVKYRDPKAPLWVVSDLSSANTPRAKGIESRAIHQQGCIWHARRRFWKVKDLDDGCWEALRLFHDIADVEDRIDHSEAPPEEIMRLRGRYSKFFFTRLVKLCDRLLKKWGKESAVGEAAEYVLANEHTLRQFLKHPFLVPHNNRVERYGRPEKLMLSASKFRDRFSGRIVYDVISTVMSTCCSNGIDFSGYALDVLRNREAAALNPELWSPFAWAQRQETVQK